MKKYVEELETIALLLSMNLKHREERFKYNLKEDRTLLDITHEIMDYFSGLEDEWIRHRLYRLVKILDKEKQTDMERILIAMINEGFTNDFEKAVAAELGEEE